MQPFKVFYLITELSTGGAQTALLHLLERLDRQRFSPVVATYYNAQAEIGERIRSLSVSVVDLGMPVKWRLDAFDRLYRSLRSEKPALTHTFLFHANVPGRILGRLAGVPAIISSERTMEMEGIARRRMNRWTARYADRIVCVSNQVAAFAEDQIGIPSEKVVVIPNGVDQASFIGLPEKIQAKRDLGFPFNKTLIGSVGRLDPVKGYLQLIEAFAALDPEKRDLHLALIGDGPQRDELEELCRSLGISGCVTFTGYQTGIPSYMAALDIFTLSSHFEGLPNAVLEAMAAGLPVVATAAGGIPDAVLDGETGLLVPPNQPKQLAEALDRMICNPELRARYGQAGRERVQAHFSVEHMVAETERLYTLLLKEKGIL